MKGYKAVLIRVGALLLPVESSHRGNGRMFRLLSLSSLLVAFGPFVFADDGRESLVSSGETLQSFTILCENKDIFGQSKDRTALEFDQATPEKLGFTHDGVAWEYTIQSTSFYNEQLGISFTFEPNPKTSELGSRFFNTYYLTYRIGGQQTLEEARVMIRGDQVELIFADKTDFESCLSEGLD